jgi:hypothetical protein
MTTGVLNNELKVGLESGVSIEKADTIRFDITMPELSSIALTGVGDFYLSGSYQDELSIEITGVGNVEAFDLEVGICQILITGIADCEVNVRDQMTVDISGVGDVLYKGNPTISSSITGVGSIIDAN